MCCADQPVHHAQPALFCNCSHSNWPEQVHDRPILSHPVVIIAFIMSRFMISSCTTAIQTCLSQTKRQFTIQASPLYVTWVPLAKLRRCGKHWSRCTCQQQIMGSCLSESLPWSLSPAGTAFQMYTVYGFSACHIVLALPWTTY